MNILSVLSLRHALAVLVLMPMLALLTTSNVAAADITTEGVLRVEDAANKKITIAVDQPYVVTGNAASARLAALNPGDSLQFSISSDGTVRADTIQVHNRVVDVSVFYRIIFAGISAVLIFAAAGRIADWNPYCFFVGVDKRTSNSQTQIVLWSLTSLVVYLTTVLLRMWFGWNASTDIVGGVEIPTNLLALSGLSGLTFAGARAITASKDAVAKAANASGQAPAVQEKQISPSAPRLRDLFRDDEGRLDFGDTQMILITVIAILIYVMKSFSFLGQIDIAPHVTMPDIDTYLLASFGVGQGAYLAKKAASDPGKG